MNKLLNGRGYTSVDKVISVFQSVGQIPTLTGAWIEKKKNSVMIDTTWLQRNLVRSKSVRFRRTYFLDENLTLCHMGFSEQNSELLVANCDKRRAIVTQPDENNKARQFIEVWENGKLDKCYDVSTLDVHGEIYCDTEFGSLEWSPCKTKLTYIAEIRLEKPESFFKVRAQGFQAEGVEFPKGCEYEYREDWGENLTSKYQSVVVTLDLKEKDAISTAECIPDHLFPGEVRWSPDGSIVGIAWETKPRKLGLVYCTNRKSYIFRITPAEEFALLSEPEKSVRSPRFSPDNKWLVWIQRDVGGPHLSTHSIVKMPWPPTDLSKPITVLGSVDSKIQTRNGKDFYGFYGLEFPKRCWLSDNELLFSTVQWNEIKSYLLNIDSGDLLELTCNNEGNYTMGSLSVLDVKDGLVCCLWSSLKFPSQLLIGKMQSECSKVSWLPISESEVISGLENHKVEYLKLTQENEDIKEFSAIYYGSDKKDSTNSPLLVWCHGGPHSAFTNSFSSIAAFFALLGFSIVQINYRGSTGQGKQSIDFLLGRVGDSDVRDCKLATDTCIERFGCLKDKCVLFGGSHGGFLVTHLSGQYPDAYRAVAARNPVIDISTMYYQSDIPDWCIAEIGEKKFSENGPVDVNLLEKMLLASPYSHAHNVKAPTLLMVGFKDLRVPPSQSWQYYHKLKANNVETRMLIYNDNHPLAKPHVEVDCIINSGIWFVRHCGINL